MISLRALTLVSVGFLLAFPNLSFAQNEADPRFPESDRSDPCQNALDRLKNFEKTVFKATDKGVKHLKKARIYLQYHQYFKRLCYDPFDHFDMVRLAHEPLEKALKKTSGMGFAYALFMKGVAFLEAHQPDSAVAFLDEAYRSGLPEPTDMVHFYYGLALQYAHRFEEAIAQYEQALQKGGESALGEFIAARILQCKNALIMGLTSNKTIAVESLGGQVNGPHWEYAPISAMEGELLYFTLRGRDPLCNLPQRKQRKELKRDLKRFSSMYLEQVYVTTGGQDGWACPQRANASINKAKHDNATAFISPMGDTLYTYRRKAPKVGHPNTLGEVYRHFPKTEDETAEEVNDLKWSKPDALNGLASRYQEPDMCISADGATVIFASDRDGGAGGFDLYMATRQEDGSLGEPVNLGPGINTPSDERAPFLFNDNKTLYFSSNAHNSIGGFDVFITQRVGEDNTWHPVKSMLPPINTAGDDIFFSRVWGQNKGFFTSDRAGGFGGYDLYSYTGPAMDLDYDSEPLEAIALLSLPFDVSADPFNFGPVRESGNTSAAMSSLGRVNFAFDKHYLTRYSQNTLDKKVLPTLTANPLSNIVIMGHTDPYGSPEYNLNLSMRRVKTVFDYLVQQGVDPSRIQYNYLGERFPLFEKGNYDQHVINRRVEIFLKGDGQLPYESELRPGTDLVGKRRLN